MLRIRTILMKRFLNTNTDYGKTFDKILIANRGEIACRVIRTAKKMGIKTVAIYSEPDANSLHVSLADEAVLVGPAPTSKSYLNISNIIKAVKSTGAQAVHPGYGFLSENSQFVKALDKAGVSFIGPNESAMYAMGDKIQSKLIAEKAGVNIIPGFNGVVKDSAHAVEISKSIGYPVMVKASAGGGGKGMRIAYSDEECVEAFKLSSAEALSSFGDDRLLVEKFVGEPRHIEIQLIGDKNGNVCYLPERECSIQRRNQKVIEEAPSPFIDPETRRLMGEQAVALAKNVGYYSAGTCEFLVDKNKRFYFLEMNTRLQVEHPVTEMVTGTDLVEWQLEVASGNYLPKFQNQLKLDGHAFEARIYAEKPENNFLPDVGPLIHMRPTSPTPTLRIETGVKQGDQVSVHYDPMICKLVVKGTDRNDALRKLRKALEEFEIVGPSTNISFLKTLASHPSFIAADVDTGFIKKHFDELFKTIPADPNMIAQAALGVIIQETLRHKTEISANSLDPWISLSDWRLNHTKQKTISFSIPSMKSNDKKKVVKVHIEFCSEVDTYNVIVLDHDGTQTVIKDVRVLNEVDGNDMIVEMNGKKSKSTVVTHNNNVYVFNSGIKLVLELDIPEFLLSSASASHTGDIITPMPCKISQVMVKAGDAVIVGQPLIILEAMKMEHVIRSPTKGIVKKLLFKEGDIVGEKKKLLIME